MEKRQCWVENNTNKALDWTTGEWMMLDCAWGSWRGMSQRKGEEGEGKGKGEKKCRRITTYVTSLRRLDLAATYICNINLFWDFSYLHLPPPCQPKPPLSHLSLSKVSIFNSKKKKRKKREKEKNVSYRVVSCR